MDEFQLNPALHDTLKGIRESVRKLFEQLRLNHENGDISGKERLERVPALAKRNFANLTAANPQLAAKEVWRLVDFLEGNEDGRLSPRARDALRPIELDLKLSALRASDLWKQVAAHLRRELGVAHSGRGTAPISARDAGKNRVDAAPAASAADFSLTTDAKGPKPSRLSGRLRRLWLGALIGVGALIATSLLVAPWGFGKGLDPRRACIAIEDASQSELARHWAPWSGTAWPRPPRSESRQQIITISDPSNGSPINSIWTTSQYSYAEGAAPGRPGGGRSDARLRVGGWGDTYLSLLRVPVPGDRLAHRAVIQLTVVGDEVGSRPTPMTLRAIDDAWSVGPGPHDRLWWRDCPQSEAMANHLPPPGPRGSVYEIDITDIYNMWAAGQRLQYGIILEPEQIGRWGSESPRYPSYNTFYSTRARNPENRPRLVLTF